VLGGAFTPIYRPRGARRLQHDDDDGREVAVSGRWSGEDLFAPADRLGRKRPREGFWKLPRVRDVLIVDEDGVYWRCRGVELGEEDEDDGLLSHDF
jgi:hypothetical protein